MRLNPSLQAYEIRILSKGPESNAIAATTGNVLSIDVRGVLRRVRLELRE